MTDDLDRLRLLHAVSRSGSIAAAARDAGVTPSAVSQQLSALERRVGVSLLERSNRGVTTTPAGAALSARAAGLLDDLAAGMAEAVRVAAARPTTPVRIAAFPTAVTTIVLPVLTSMVVDVPITIVHAEPRAAMDALLDRSVDLAIVDEYDAAPHPMPARVDADLLMDDTLRLIVPSARAGARLADLGDIGWVLGPIDSRLGHVGRLVCRQAGVVPRLLAETDDHHLSFAIAAAVGAATVQPALTLTDLPADGSLVVSDEGLGIRRRLILLRRHLVRPDPSLARVSESLLGSAAHRGDDPFAQARTSSPQLGP